MTPAEQHAANFKPGDKVIVSGADGEWEVDNALKDGRLNIKELHAGRYLCVLPSMLTPVEPPLPPEPPVGSVVLLRNSWRSYVHESPGRWWGPRGLVRWDTLCGFDPVHLVDPTDDEQLRAAGLCRVDDVIKWWWGASGNVLYRRQHHFRETFGGGA